MDRCASYATVLLLGCATIVGCAHAPVQTGDPVEDARALLSELAAADGTCAAGHVMRDLTFLDPTSRSLSQGPHLGAQTRPVDHGLGKSALNLSQASAAMSQTWEFQRSVDGNARAGLPVPGGARPGSGEVGLAQLPPSSPGDEDADAAGVYARWSRSYFASGWTIYFDAGTDEDTRNAVLDTLTSWSLNDPSLLRAYWARFNRASRRDCGGP